MGRQADGENLVRMGRTATNEAERTAVRHAMHKIQNETPLVRSMRESLIKATRQNDHKKIQEIHEYVATHKKFQNE